MSHNNAHGYEFGPYRFDPGQRVLECAGEKVSLTPKAVEILTLLVSNAGQLVERDALLSRVWPDTFVEESNITQNVFLLRRALGDRRRPAKYIETVARRGYRFVAGVKVSGASETAEGDDVDGAPIPPTVAVLPFVNATEDPDAEYLADGVTESLVNTLCRISKLRVMSRSAVFRYKKNELDPRVIGKELGVDVVLVGTITSRATGIVISVELVQVFSGWQLWGESFDGELKDLLEIQDALTRRLLGALKVKLSGEEEKRVTARYTESAEAYQSYLAGRYNWSQYTRKGIEKAIFHFRRAIELDPNYALAYAGIIDCYLRLTTNYLPPEGDLPTSTPQKGARKSRVKKPRKNTDPAIDDTEARVKLRFELDWKLAQRELNRALELRYGHPTAHQWYAAYRFAKELFEQSTGRAADVDLSRGSNLPAQIVSGEPSNAELLQVLCAIARDQLAVLNYEAAELVLKGWAPQNDWPKLGSLTPHGAADLLFTLGLLTSSLATTRQTTNGYRRAAALLNGSIALFEHLNTKSRSVEARTELARCYYRQGLFDIATETISAALSELPTEYSDIKCLCLIYWGMCQRDAGRVKEAVSKLEEAATVMAPAGPLVTLRYHVEMAGTLKDLPLTEQGICDQIRLHYRTALYQSYAIGDHRTTATAENNLGLFLLSLEAWDEAEEHLLRARRFFEALSDTLRRAQVNETLTRLYIATSRNSLAQAAIEDAIQTLELTDSEALFSEALTTGAIVSCRVGRFGEAQKRFESACKVSERCGDREGALRALLSMFEEMGDRLGQDDVRQILDKLKRLESLAEQSSFAPRVRETIAQIEEAIRRNDQD